MIGLVFVWLVIISIICLANARTIAQNADLISQQEEEIKQLQNESAYLHRQMMIRHSSSTRASGIGRSVQQLEERAKEIQRKLAGEE